MIQVPIYRAYSTCRQFGLIESYHRGNRGQLSVVFITSAKVEELKTEPTFHVEGGEITFKHGRYERDYYTVSTSDNDDSSDDDNTSNYADDNSEAENELSSTFSNNNLSPPDPESPQNILNTLNDDCLYEIFAKLEWYDLYATVDVCHRFRDIARQVASTKRTIKITSENLEPMWRVERYLRMFGASIQRVNVDACQQDMIVLFLISKFCANVDGLDISWIDKLVTNELDPLLKRLRKLCIGNTCTVNEILHSDSQLESLEIKSSAKLPIIHLPKLVELRLQRPPYVDFCILNQQIEKLTIKSRCSSVDDIVRHLPYLQELGLELSCLFTLTNASVFGALSRLHTIQLIDCPSDQFRILQAFIDGGVQLKRLTLRGSRKYSIAMICQMKSIEYLQIDDLLDVDVVQLIENCINLKGVDFSESLLTLEGIVNALKSIYRHCRLAKAKLAFEVSIDEPDDIMTFEKSLDAITELCTDRRVNVKVHMALAITGYIGEETAVNMHR